MPGVFVQEVEPERYRYEGEIGAGGAIVQPAIERMADEALAEHAAGLTQELTDADFVDEEGQGA